MSKEFLKIILIALCLFTLWALWRFVQPQWRWLSPIKRCVIALLLVSLCVSWGGALMGIRWVWVLGTLGVSVSILINLYLLHREAANG